MNVLVAGATGALGHPLVAEFVRRGHRVRALVRERARGADLTRLGVELVVADLTGSRAELRAACAGVEVVACVAGQTTTLARVSERAPFRAVDRDGVVRLLDAAVAAGAHRFLAVSVFNAARLRGLEYVDAHEEAVDALRVAPIEATVMRANGFTSSYRELVDLARAGRTIPLIGNGRCRSNPIHPIDLAVACADAVAAGTPIVDAGGPEVLTRREELELVFAAADRAARLPRVPGILLPTAARVLRPFDARRAAMLAFTSAINQIDMVAPSVGQRRLFDDLQAHAVRTVVSAT